MLIKKTHAFTIIICAIGIFAFSSMVGTAGLGDAPSLFRDVGGQAGADTYDKPEVVVGKGISAALTLVGMIFMVLMVYAGYLWMTARGEEAQVEKAQKIITTALIGFFIVASAYAITKFVSSKFEGSDSGGAGGGSGVGAGDEGTGMEDEGCCVTCEDDQPFGVHFGDAAVYQLKTQKDCLNDKNIEDGIYTQWFEFGDPNDCNGDIFAPSVKLSCEGACKNFESLGKCNY